MFLRKWRQNQRRQTIERLYGVIVAQARTPRFYAAWGVPDTLEGRFDLLVLHVYLTNRRLAATGPEAASWGQDLLDIFFENMDAGLREYGIGDLAVPKKMRSLAEAYLGRATAYDAALADGDRSALAAALSRNVYGVPDASAAAELAAYVIAAIERLDGQGMETILAAQRIFPEPAEAGHHV